ncbi:T9SS type A sorting domain-containing protein [Dyadobacter subterraneus]|uniref:Cellulase family glycosylhydrolase n=1 Tax=Dyadobacter subterraneus TaxID=2773304 RepID=A0ABR9W8B8_9BACT|nr:T9SS type A sorting domain-containing protein [Dyadobacter subterraneus]MBE9461714.1 cellulase family glycosylhydrolase [Dyadobacter subterraneus]
MKHSQRGLVTLFVLCFFSSLSFGIDLSQTITSGGKSRSFVFHAPGSIVAQNLPLLFVFHGDGGSGSGIKGSTGFDAIADANNFIVVYPNADNDGNGWNRAIDQLKDVNFTSDMIDYFCSTYHINAQKVYASGHSAGGFMTYNLAVNLPGRIAAFAPVAGNMYANNGNYSYFSSPNFKPVPILHIHGDPDGTVDYPDPDHQPTNWSEWPLTEFSYYTCGKITYTLPNATIATNVTKLSFCVGSPPATKEISLIRVAGAGHSWPAVAGFNPAQVIWDFVKAYSITTVPSCVVVPETPTYVEGTIHTQGNAIMSPCNEVFIPRGMNYSLADDWEFPANMNGDPTGVNNELSAEIIKAKPNIVRIEWYANRAANWKPYSVADLDVVITRFRNAGIVSVMDLHDLTCSNDYTQFNNIILPWWKQQSVKDLIAKHKGYVLVNVANEFGNVNWASDKSAAYTTWLNHYKAVITDLRSAGIQVPLMIDAPDCGQSLDIALQAGAALRMEDPLHNIIMSAHAYWYADNAAAMETRVQQIANAAFPIVLGEIANIQDATGPCSNTIPAYKDLLQSCQNHNVGWLAWTWTDDFCEGINGRRMSMNGSFTNLSTYGNTIVNDPNFGLATHATKMNVQCLSGPLPVKLQSFEAKETEENQILVQWKTSSEINFKQFELERSVDGKRFEQLAILKPEAASNNFNYNFADTKLIEPTYYYRLKMVDLDETFAYSGIVSVERKSFDPVVVYPSPTRDFIQIKASENVFPAKIKIIDQSGRIVLSQTVLKQSQKISIDGLSAGIYIISMQDIVVGKVIVQGK